MAALREILAEFGIQFDKEKSLEKGDKAVDGMASKLAGFGKTIAGVFAVGAIFNWGRELINQADELREAGIALGIVPQHLQQLEFAASTAGVEVGELRASLTKFNKTAGESASGKGAAAEFKKLGVEFKNSDGTVKSSGVLFEEVGSKLAAIEDPIERAGIAGKFFGRSYAKLLPLFAEGPEGIKKLKEEATELGFVFDDTFLEQSDEINDNLTRLKGGLRGILIQAVAPLLPGLVAMTQGGVRFVKQAVAWLKSTKLIQAATIALGTKGVFMLIKAIPLLVAKMGGWRAAFGTLGKFILRTLLPLLLLEDIIVFFAGGKSALGRGLDKMFGKGTQEKVRSFFTVFTKGPDAVRAKFDEFAAALKQKWGALGTFLGGWAKGFSDVVLFAIDLITGGWENAGEKISALADGLDLVFSILWTEVKFAGLATAAALSDAWDEFFNDFREKAATIAKIAGFIPGAGGAAAALSLVAASDPNKGPRASETIADMRTQERLALADRGDKIGKRLTETAEDRRIKADSQGFGTRALPERTVPLAPQAPSVTQTNAITVSVTVPPGTPAQQAQAVANAATIGVKKGINTRQLEAALVPTGG